MIKYILISDGSSDRALINIINYTLKQQFNLDFDGEITTEFAQTNLIQNKLEELLREVILPNNDFKIAHRWSGIMGLGSSKKTIVSQLSQNVY